MIQRLEIGENVNYVTAIAFIFIKIFRMNFLCVGFFSFGDAVCE